MVHRKFTGALRGGLTLAIAVGMACQVQAYGLYADEDTHLNADCLAV